ncbi:hypothetical protein EVAR_73133_1 [Eumeta japonica]|uniref:Uncharacterized protein n=1 Tax=Eumeta variegata TaxID=151549 RepID=A0A4C1T3W7_EUMVA|nr:hypothetical protein EVAR_73133_1 [Eumeta japonica]
MVCWRESAAWGALTELCLNQGSEILRRLLCCLGGAPAAGGGGVPIAPALARERLRPCHLRYSARREAHCGGGTLHSLSARARSNRTPPAGAHYAASVSSHASRIYFTFGKDPPCH